jgi:hypothetical protein
MRLGCPPTMIGKVSRIVRTFCEEVSEQTLSPLTNYQYAAANGPVSSCIVGSAGVETACVNRQAYEVMSPIYALADVPQSVFLNTVHFLRQMYVFSLAMRGSPDVDANIVDVAKYMIAGAICHGTMGVVSSVTEANHFAQNIRDAVGEGNHSDWQHLTECPEHLLADFSSMLRVIAWLSFLSSGLGPNGVSLDYISAKFGGMSVPLVDADGVPVHPTAEGTATKEGVLLQFVALILAGAANAANMSTDDVAFIARMMSPSFDTRIMAVIIAVSDERRPCYVENKVGNLMSTHLWLTKRHCDEWSVQTCQQFQIPFHLLHMSPNRGAAPTDVNIARSMSGENLQDETAVWRGIFDGECHAATEAVNNADFLAPMSSLPTVHQLLNDLWGTEVKEQATHVMKIVAETQAESDQWTIVDGHLDYVSVPTSASQPRMSFHFKHSVGALLSEWAQFRGSRCHCGFDMYK